MRILIFLTFLFSGTVWSSTEANCHLVDDGIYINSKNVIEDLKFEALVDTFSLGASKTLSFKLDGVQLRFLRMNMEVKKYTKMYFLMTSKESTRTAIVQIDRKPKMALKDKAFNGNILVTHDRKNLTYNFYCSF